MMPPFDLERSLKDAELRLPAKRAGARRQPRSDAGRSRLPAAIAEALLDILRRQERPPMHEVMAELAAFCRQRHLRMPARATIYRFMAQCPPRLVRISELPESVRKALYNLDPDGMVPGHQLAFYAFNYGDVRAMSFAAGLPWLDLYQADRMRGWRPRSHGLVRAVMLRRGI